MIHGHASSIDPCKLQRIPPVGPSPTDLALRALKRSPPEGRARRGHHFMNHVRQRGRIARELSRAVALGSYAVKNALGVLISYARRAAPQALGRDVSVVQAS